MLMADMGNLPVLFCPPFNCSRKSLHSRYSFLSPLLFPPFHLGNSSVLATAAFIPSVPRPFFVWILRILISSFTVLTTTFFSEATAFFLFISRPSVQLIFISQCKSINVVVRSACSGNPWLRYHNILLLWDILVMRVVVVATWWHDQSESSIQTRDWINKLSTNQDFMGVSTTCKTITKSLPTFPRHVRHTKSHVSTNFILTSYLALQSGRVWPPIDVTPISF